ncbi:histone-fold-containing protein [Thelephora ganbajun]|uniref:Histone-fold-containing protein n=1 Tax=Thelephora ganbajun TaxID=370292 RepID=A0ACB6ZVS8_THEGA|nr:histone-fold-containing protein [Thelephora ganbajun]
MPPKEKAANTGVTAESQRSAASDGIYNYELPRSLVAKIARASVPDNCKFQKETILALLKGSTVFINCLAAGAHEIAKGKQHKSISASDVLRALEHLQLGDLVGPLQDELPIYRELQKSGRKSVGSKNKGSASTSVADPASSMGPPQSIPKKGKGAAMVVPISEGEDGNTQGQPADADMDVDTEMNDMDDAEEADVNGSQGEEGEEDEDEENEELVDQMAVEDEELRDTKGLDLRDPRVEVDENV